MTSLDDPERFLYDLSCIEFKDEVEIPSLPDDLMLMIFDELSDEERVPLGLTSKRFRNLDFELGKRNFARINFNWEWNKHEMSGIVRKDASVLYWYNVEGNNSSPIRPSYHNLRLFKAAKTNSLGISYNKIICDPADLQLIASLLETVSYNKLHLNFTSTQNCTEVVNLIPLLLRGRNLEKSQVYLSLRSIRGHYDMERTRNMLMQLPKIDKFRLDRVERTSTVDSVTPNECVIDDATLLHIVNNTNHAELMNGDCTGEGIKNAFEIVCESPHERKFVSLFVSKLAVTELFSIPNLRFSTVDESEIRDARTQSVLTVIQCTSYCKIEMCKQNDYGTAQSEDVNWSIRTGHII